MSFSFGQMNRITDNLYLGPAVSVQPERLRMMGISCVINCTNEVPALTGVPHIETVRLSLDDVPSANISVHFDRIGDKIRSVRDRGGCTLVHCAAGVSRSATMCIAYLMRHHRMTLLEAYTHVKRCRPVIHPNPGFFRQLIDYERRLFRGVNTVNMISSPMGFIPDVYQNETANMVMLNGGSTLGGNFTVSNAPVGGNFTINNAPVGGNYGSGVGGYSAGGVSSYPSASNGYSSSTMGNRGLPRVDVGNTVGITLSRYSLGR